MTEIIVCEPSNPNRAGAGRFAPVSDLSGTVPAQAVTGRLRPTAEGFIPSLLLLLLMLAPALWAAPAKLTITLPDTSAYTYWVQSKTGAVSIQPSTVSGKKMVMLSKPVADGDTVYVLDKHDGQVATRIVQPGAAQPIALTAADFKPIASAAPPAPAAVPAPAPAAPKEVTPVNGIGRLFTLLFGLIVAAGVIWVILHLIRTRGEPLLALARKAGVDVPDPTAIDSNAEAAPVYTPPAPHPVEKIPDEASAPPLPIAAGASRRRAPAVSPTGIPQIVGTQGVAAGTTFTLNQPEVTIGRDGDNDLVLVDKTVSRRHCRLTRDPAGQITIADEGSANGIYINSERVQSAILAPGDEIKIGDNYFFFEA